MFEFWCSNAELTITTYGSLTKNLLMNTKFIKSELCFRVT